jgi:hypothetical protein
MDDQAPLEQEKSFVSELVNKQAVEVERMMSSKEERRLAQREKWPLPADYLDNTLSESTRKTRRSLLAVSALGIAIVWTGLFPEKIAFFGIEFAKVELAKLLWLIVAIILFFLLEFLAYCVPDLQNFLLQLYEAGGGRWVDLQMKRLWSVDWKDHIRGKSEIQRDRDKLLKSWGRRKRLLIARSIIEFGVPIVVACISILYIRWHVYK